MLTAECRALSDKGCTTAHAQIHPLCSYTYMQSCMSYCNYNTLEQLCYSMQYALNTNEKDSPFKIMHKYNVGSKAFFSFFNQIIPCKIMASFTKSPTHAQWSWCWPIFQKHGYYNCHVTDQPQFKCQWKVEGTSVFSSAQTAPDRVKGSYWTPACLCQHNTGFLKSSPFHIHTNRPEHRSAHPQSPLIPITHC